MPATGSLLQRIPWTAAKTTVGPQPWYFYSTGSFDPLAFVYKNPEINNMQTYYGTLRSLHRITTRQHPEDTRYCVV
jgi:hypothetical protein